jgi:hypothetical protein
MRNEQANSFTEHEIDALMQQDAVDALIADAVRSAPLPQLPADFAAQVVRQLDAAPQRDSLGLRLSVWLLVAQAVFGLYFVVLLVRDNLDKPFGQYLPLVLLLLLVAAAERLLEWKSRIIQSV